MKVRGVTGAESRVALFQSCFCHRFETFDFEPCDPSDVLDQL
jgi:hypothetical protein